MPSMATCRLLSAAAIVAGVLPLAAATPAQADALLYRCGPNVCRAAPDGSGNQQLTSDGRPGGPSYGWLSASTNGSRMAVVRATFAYVLDSRGRTVGRALPRGGTAVIAEIAPDGRQVATIELVPELTPAPVGSPPGSPGISGLQPYLFVVGADGAGREAAARAVVDTGWLGGRLVRTDTSRSAPFPLGICLLAVNTDFRCERDIARDPMQHLHSPAFSPNGRLVAVVRAPGAAIGAGPIALYDTATRTRAPRDHGWPAARLGDDSGLPAPATPPRPRAGSIGGRVSVRASARQRDGDAQTRRPARRPPDRPRRHRRRDHRAPSPPSRRPRGRAERARELQPAGHGGAIARASRSRTRH